MLFQFQTDKNKIYMDNKVLKYILKQFIPKFVLKFFPVFVILTLELSQFHLQESK